MIGAGASGSGSVRPGSTSRGSGSNNGGTILGRPNGGAGSGKSGRNDSNESHNVGIGRIKPGELFDVPPVSSNSRIRREGYRENRVENGRFRNGYCGYDSGWSDNRFWYPYYGYTWYSGCNYVCSPFYYYYHLPAYVNVIRVSIGPVTWVHCNTPYVWNAPVYDRYGYNSDRYLEFDYSVDDIRNAFDRRDMRSMTHLIPTRGRVQIDMAGDNQYSLDGSDFYDMMRDLVEGTRTIDYRIVNVYRDGGRATVIAEHTYEDPWGREERVRHEYGLQEGRRGYEITYFRTDR